MAMFYKEMILAHSFFSISCKGVTLRKIAVNKKHERVFVVCGKEEPIAMEMCQPGFLFHEAANRCLPTCRGIGNFPVHGQEKRYASIRVLL